MDEYKARLADYIAVLEQSAKETARAEDRNRYQQHMAAAASMFSAIEKDKSVERLKELVASEKRSFGWDYLAGSAGEAAEAAFHAFAAFVENQS